MKKNNLLKEEVSRIWEIMGIKNNTIHEQWWRSIGQKIVGNTLSEFIDAADKILGKTVTKFDDLSDDLIQDLMKNLPKGEYITLKTAFAKSVADEIGMTPQIFQRKTIKQLADICAQNGLDPQESANFIKWYSKSNNVAPVKVKPIGFGSSVLDFKGSTIDDLIAVAEIDPKFKGLFEKSPDSKNDLRKLLEINFSRGVSEEDLQAQIPRFMAKVEEAVKNGKIQSGLSYDKIINFIGSLLSKKYGKAAVVLLIAGLLAGLYTLRDVGKKAKEIYGDDAPELPEEPSSEEGGGGSLGPDDY